MKYYSKVIEKSHFQEVSVVDNVMGILGSEKGPLGLVGVSCTLSYNQEVVIQIDSITLKIKPHPKK